MEVTGARPASLVLPANDGRSAEKAATSFADWLAQALDRLNADQVKAERAALRLAAGDVANLHNLFLALQQASLSLQLAVQVRNKALEAYQDVFRMPL
ncbi:MAG TPA: flagellar hook-basal body complex protein FliE [Calditerricola sp.]